MSSSLQPGATPSSAPLWVKQFDRDGIIGPLGSVPAPLVKAARTLVVAQTTNGNWDFGDQTRVNNLHLDYGEIWSLVTSQIVISAVRAVLLGEDVLLISTGIICKRPHSGTRKDNETFEPKWHQDRIFWGLQPWGAKVVLTMIALDHFGDGTGATHFVPAAHHKFSNGSGEFFEHNSAGYISSRSDGVAGFPSERHVSTLAPGEFSIQDGYVVHDSRRNYSDVQRLAIFAVWAESCVELVDQPKDVGSEGLTNNTAAFWIQFKREWRQPIHVPVEGCPQSSLRLQIPRARL